MESFDPDTDVVTDAASPLPRSRLVVVSGVNAGAELLLERGTYRVGSEPTSDLVLTDASVSRTHLVLKVLADAVEVTDPGSTNGSFLAASSRETRFTSIRISPPAALRVGRTELRLVFADAPVRARAPSTSESFGRLRGKSLPMRELFGILERIAPSDSDVLLRGETGTGKELCAEALHAHSQRKGGPFVVCDLASVAPSLLESELFGHVKGAFTGAVRDREGAFERADQGTLFLDEIGDLSLELQPRLLRALERRQVKRVGANAFQTVDVRVVCATHRDLREEVAAGRFREDLYHRLAVLLVQLPPLRERGADIPELAQAFATSLGADASALTPRTQALLRAYHWPGNVRELRNVVERVVRLGDAAEFPEGTTPPPAAAVKTPRNELPFKEAKEQLVDSFERDYVQQLLSANGGNISRAAKQAGIVRVYLQRLMRKHGLSARDEPQDR